MADSVFKSSGHIWVTNTRRQGSRICLAGQWEIDTSLKNLFFLAQSYDFIAEFFMSYPISKLRRTRNTVSQENKRQGYRAIYKELFDRLDRGGCSMPPLLNCTHLACELALKQFVVRAIYCDSAGRPGLQVLPNSSFPATHSISALFAELPAIYRKELEDCYIEWMTQVSVPYNPPTSLIAAIARFSEAQLDIRYNTIEDRASEVLVAITTVSRFLCRGVQAA